MFGLYKRDKKDKGYKWGKWNRDVGGGGDFANYYDDDYGDGFYEGDEVEELDELDEIEESEEEKQKKSEEYLDNPDDG